MTHSDIGINTLDKQRIRFSYYRKNKYAINMYRQKEIVIRDSFIVNHCHHNDARLYYLPSPSHSMYHERTWVNIYFVYFLSERHFIYCDSAKILIELHKRWFIFSRKLKRYTKKNQKCWRMTNATHLFVLWVHRIIDGILF